MASVIYLETAARAGERLSNAAAVDIARWNDFILAAEGNEPLRKCIPPIVAIFENLSILVKALHSEISALPSCKERSDLQLRKKDVLVRLSLALQVLHRLDVRQGYGPTVDNRDNDPSRYVELQPS